MPTNNYLVGTADLQLIHDALKRGLDVRLHPDKYGLKITTEKVTVLRKPEAPKQYGYSEKRFVKDTEQ